VVKYNQKGERKMEKRMVRRTEDYNAVKETVAGEMRNKLSFLSGEWGQEFGSSGKTTMF
jgi:tetrahydromethanopterin S-methyltransferase subunit G